MLTLTALLGVLAGVVATADSIPYVRDVIRGATRPHRGTWLVWSVLGIVVCASQRADGASWSLIMAGTQATATTLIFILAIRRGEGGVTRGELLLMTIALAGIAGWALAEAPLVATACVVAADLIGLSLMLPKTYRDPDSETLATFVLASFSGLLAAAAVGAPDLALLLYPGYFAVGNAALATLIVHRRHQLQRSARPAAMWRVAR
jgi:hypothetical protein